MRKGAARSAAFRSRLDRHPDRKIRKSEDRSYHQTAEGHTETRSRTEESENYDEVLRFLRSTPFLRVTFSAMLVQQRIFADQR